MPHPVIQTADRSVDPILDPRHGPRGWRDPLTVSIGHLVSALREELRQYGEFLALLEEDGILEKTCSVSEDSETPAAIQIQRQHIEAARIRREQCLKETKRLLRVDPNVGSAELLQRLPQVYRPLTRALLEENEALLGRIRELLDLRQRRQRCADQVRVLRSA